MTKICPSACSPPRPSPTPRWNGRTVRNPLRSAGLLLLLLGAAPLAPGQPPAAEPDRAAAAAPAAAPPGPWRLRLERGLLEAGVLTASDRPTDASYYGQAVASAARPLGERWELRLGARLDGHVQHGRDSDRSHLDADYDETWLRYRSDRWRLTVGAQQVLWGRTDEISPTDRLSTKDFTRFALDDLADRRRASPALRLEGFHDAWTLDLLWLPVFRPAELPDLDGVWSPVDRRQGRILGLPDDPALAELVRAGDFRDDPSRGGSGGARLSRTGRGLDYAVTLQRARHSAPYYRLDETARLTLLATGDPHQALAAARGPTFDSPHPYTWVVGGDLALARGAWTWRLEAAWLSAVPVTRTDLSPDTASGFDWVIGAETFPGDRDLRVTAQLAGLHLLDISEILDRRSAYYFNGEVEDLFFHGRWRGRLRWNIGLDRRDLYLNPEIAWIGWEPQEFYLGLHWLDGAGPTTLGGFYAAQRVAVLGWRGQF